VLKGGVGWPKAEAHRPSRFTSHSWFPEPRDLVLGFQAVTTVFRPTLIIIPTGTIGIRTFTIIRMLGIHIHITPLRQPIGTVGIGFTGAIIATTITTASKAEWTYFRVRDVIGTHPRSQTTFVLFCQCKEPQ
jgi:predicted membrane protein